MTIKVIAQVVAHAKTLYKPATAHYFVPASKGREIVDKLNETKFNLGSGLIWDIVKIDENSTAFNFYKFQRFIFENGTVREQK